MNVISINGTEHHVPSSWDELSREQMIYLAGLFPRKMSVISFKVHLLWKLLNVKARYFFGVSAEDMSFVLKSMDWVMENVTMKRNMLPLIRIGWHRYHGPEDMMGSCTFGEMTRAHQKMEDYVATKDEKYLDDLVAVLYRPKKRGWWLRKRFSVTTDRRVRYIEKSVAVRAKRIKSLDISVKYAVYLFFVGVMNTLPEKFPNVYRRKGDSSGKNNYGWATLIISLADGKTDDDSLDKVFYSNMYNVFLGMEQKATEYFKFMEKYGHDN